MAITHKQLTDIFGFTAVKGSAYGIKAYLRDKSGVEIFAKKNELDIIVPGVSKQNYSLEFLGTENLMVLLPEWIRLADKKRNAKKPTVEDVFEIKVYRETAFKGITLEEVDDFPARMLKHSYGG